MDKTSIFFDFHENIISKSQPKIMKYIGWSGLVVLKFNMKADEQIKSLVLDAMIPELKKKEKIFFLTKGNISLVSEKHQIHLKEYDVFNYLNVEEKFNLLSTAETTLYMVSCDKANLLNEKSRFFNFKNDIEIRNLWGGRCLSRPYQGKNLTLVLFDLKQGFEFSDNGHSNEQITWLINGQMNFHVNKIQKILNTENGVSIGPNCSHGGISDGAIGFDVFFPKRDEKKYKGI
jgi:quercetin dioxygenase-like cupin family protein